MSTHANDASAAGRVTILGINGHIGQFAARAFVAGGWEVTGFGRSNKAPVPGVGFVRGDADGIEDMAAAVAGADVVVNALNLRYDQWDRGRYEALTSRVIAAMGRVAGRTMLFPANIYNYAATLRHVTPEAAQQPETPRGAIRVRVEAMLREAAESGAFRLATIRAGDFFGPGTSGDWFDQIMLREAGKARFSVPGRPGIGHSWAYLPDLGRAFERVARARATFGAVESFHFSGHYVTPEEMAAAIAAAAPMALTRTTGPWTMLRLVGLFSPVVREVVKMRYLWEYPMQLEDARLDALLGPGFGTPFRAAVAATVGPVFAARAAAAATAAPVRT